MMTKNFDFDFNSGFISAIHVAIVTVITSTPVFLPGATSDLIRKDIGLRPEGIGLVFTLYWIGSVVGAFASRRASGSFSIERRISISILATTIALAAMSVYPRIGLWIGAIIGGASYGYSQPYTNFLIMRRCATHIQGFAFGLKQAAIPAATLICSISVPFLAVPLGWRRLFVFLSLIFLTHALILVIGSRKSSLESKSTVIRRLPLNRHLIILAIVGAFGAMIGNSLGGFLITSLTHEGITLKSASLIAAVASMANIIVRVKAGIIVDRFARLSQRLLMQMFAVGILGTALLTIPSYPAQIIGAILAYGGGWGWAGLLHYVTGKTYPGRESQATAVSQMGVSIGAALGPLLFGWIFSNVGSTFAWITLTVAGALACIFIAVAHRIEPNDQKSKINTEIA